MKIPRGFWRKGNDLIPVTPGPPPPILDKCKYCNAAAVAGKIIDGDRIDLCAYCYKISVGAL